MKESYGEGFANHTSLESCGNCSNVMAEALTEGSAYTLVNSVTAFFDSLEHVTIDTGPV
jgi:hypothetical protein